MKEFQYFTTIGLSSWIVGKALKHVFWDKEPSAAERQTPAGSEWAPGTTPGYEQGPAADEPSEAFTPSRPMRSIRRFWCVTLGRISPSATKRCNPAEVCARESIGAQFSRLPHQRQQNSNCMYYRGVPHTLHLSLRRFQQRSHLTPKRTDSLLGDASHPEFHGGSQGAMDSRSGIRPIQLQHLQGCREVLGGDGWWADRNNLGQELDADHYARAKVQLPHRSQSRCPAPRRGSTCRPHAR